MASLQKEAAIEAELSQINFNMFEKKTLENGDIYQGELSKSNKFHGKGKLTSKLSVYKGYFEQNHKSGKGIEELKNGNVYRGLYEENLFHGFGVLEQVQHNDREKVNKYEGIFSKGKKCGLGKEIRYNGDVYTGFFSDDKYEGNGMMTSLSDYQYKGEFHQGYKHGRGKEVYAEEGSSYVGQFC